MRTVSFIVSAATLSAAFLALAVMAAGIQRVVAAVPALAAIG